MHMILSLGFRTELICITGTLVFSLEFLIMVSKSHNIGTQTETWNTV